MSNSVGDKNFPKWGEIWLVKFKKTEESRKTQRPCLVVSDNEQNEFDKWIVMTPITTDDLEKIKPVEVYIENTLENGLDEPSKIQMNYPFTTNKKLRLAKYLGIANKEIMEKAKFAWETAFRWKI